MDLLDFRAANFDASEIGVIRAALRAFIDERLAKEPGMRKRFEAARKERQGHKSEPLRLVRPDEAP